MLSKLNLVDIAKGMTHYTVSICVARAAHTLIAKNTNMKEDGIPIELMSAFIGGVVSGATSDLQEKMVDGVATWLSDRKNKKQDDTEEVTAEPVV
jgi:hypothetical protein